MSRRRYSVLSGSLFAYWSQIERFVRIDSNTQIRMIRLKMTDGRKIVGVLLSDDSVVRVLKDLNASSTEAQQDDSIRHTHTRANNDHRVHN